MNPHTTSHTLSQQLYERGLRMESIFFWVGVYNIQTKVWAEPALMFKYEDSYTIIDERKREVNTFVFNSSQQIPAYLASELGEILPHFINERGVFVGQFMGWKNPQDFTVAYGTFKKVFHKETAATEVDARAKMLISLHDKGYIDLATITPNTK